MPCRRTPRMRSRRPFRCWKMPSTPASTLPSTLGIGRASSVGRWRWPWEKANDSSGESPCVVGYLDGIHNPESRVSPPPPPPAIWHQTGFTSEAEAVEVQRHGYPTATSFYAVRGCFGDIPAAPKPARVTWIRCPGRFRLAPAGAPPSKAFR